MKKRNQLPAKNLFNNHQRNPAISSNVTLPIIPQSSLLNFKRKIIQMATNNKSTVPSNNIPTDFRMTQTKPFTRNLNRSNTLSMPKSTLNNPTISPHSNNHRQNTRYLYLINRATTYHQTVSTRIPNNNSTPVLPSQSSIFPRPYSQYGHFLAYLRRQSLARTRRKQEEDEGNIDHIQTTITLNLNKPLSRQSLQSTSRNSLTLLTIDPPMISMTAKRSGRFTSSYLPIRRSITPYRLNPFRQTPSPITKNSIDEQLITLTSSSLLITPRNSVENDSTMSPIKNPFELYLNDDMLNNNRIKHQRQIISTSV
jgi:hypothetical protein